MDSIMVCQGLEHFIQRGPVAKVKRLQGAWEILALLLMGMWKRVFVSGVYDIVPLSVASHWRLANTQCNLM